MTTTNTCIICGSGAVSVADTQLNAVAVGAVGFAIIIGAMIVASRVGARYLRTQQTEIAAMEAKRKAGKATSAAGISVN